MNRRANALLQKGLPQESIGGILFIAGYAIAVYLGLRLEDVFGEVSIVWPASGVTLALLILTERSKRKILLGFLFAASIAAYLINGQSLTPSILYSLADTFEAALGLWVLTRFCGERITFTRTQETVVLVGIIAAVAGGTTLIEAWATSLTSQVSFLYSWYSWWVADGIGILLFTPFIITWAVNPYNVQDISLRRALEGLVLLILLLVSGWIVFGSQALSNNVYVFTYFVFPILIWSGLRFSPRGSTTILLALSTLTVWLTLQRYNEANLSGAPLYEELLYRDGLLGAAAISSLFLATIVTELKLGQLALKTAAKDLGTSEARYRALFEQSHDAVFILDFNGNHIAANKRAAEMLGYTMEEIQKLSVRDTSAEKDKSDGVMRKLLAGEPVPIYERLFRKKGGEIIPVEINVELVRDSDGNPLHLQSVVRDISSRKEAEAKLLERERHSESLLRLSRNLERAQTYTEVLDVARHEVRATLGYQNVWVYLLSEDKQSLVALSASGEISKDVMSKDSLAILPIGDDPFLRQIAQAKEILIIEDASKDERANKEIVAHLRNHTIIHVPIALFDEHIGWVGTGTFGEEGVRLPTKSEQEFLITLASHLAVTLDRIHLLDERLQAERKLRESEALLRSAQKIAGLGHYVLDFQTGSWQTSEVLNDILGMDGTYPFDINSWIAVLHPEHREEVLDHFAQNVLKQRQPFDLEHKIIRVADHQTRWVHGLGEVEYDENNIPLRMIGTIQDITERKQREQELESFLEISQSLAGTLELRQVLEKILSATVRAIPNGEKGTILLLNENEELVISTSIGYQDPRVPASSFPLSTGYAARAFREKRPLLLSDVAADDSNRHNGDIAEMSAIKSAIVAPLILQERAIGAIAVDNASRTDAFNLDNIHFLTTLAASAALVIENARLFDETHKRLAEMEALQAVSAALRTAQTIEDALSIILDETLKALGTEAGMILLYNPVTGRLEEKVKRGWFEQLLIEPLGPGEGISGTVFLSGEPYISLEFAQDRLAQPLNRDRIQPGWGGACVPIRTTTETIGVIFISMELPRQISPIQMKLLNALAEMTGAALQRMKLHEETTRRAEEFSALYQTSTAISGEHNLAFLLQTIVEQAASLLGSSAGGMYLYDSTSNELEMSVTANLSVPYGTRLKPGEGMAGRVAQNRQPIRVDDYSVWEGRSQLLENLPIRAVLEVPMLYDGELIGVLVAEETGDSPRKYTEEDERLLSLFAAQAAGAIRSARLYEETVRRVRYLQTLRSIDRAITANMDSNVTLKILLNQAISQANIDAVSILLFNPNTLRLEYRLGEGFRTRENQKASIRLGEDYAGVVALERRMISLSNPSDLPEGPFREFLIKECFSCCHLVPMIAKGQVLGVLQVFSRELIITGREWLEFLEALATQAAIAVDNSYLFQDLQHANFELSLAYDATIERWSTALESRQKESDARTKQMIDWTVQLARQAGVDEKAIGHIRRGAILHDIGNMAVPDRILQKPSALNQKEREIMCGHPSFAYDMLTQVNFLRPALDIPYCHHEKWDGSGYPRGLIGEQIPIAARIFAVVDVWNALTSDRPYRKAWNKKKALDYLRSQAGKQFDPKIVDLFLQFLDKMEGDKHQN